MKNLFKRLFACCLAVCMVVTMCSVLFTVSAAQTGTVTVATVEATTTDAEVVVPVTIQAADSGLKAAQIWLGVSNLTIAKIELKGEELSKLEASYVDANDANVVLDYTSDYASTTAPKVYEGGQISILVESDYVIKTAIVIEITFAGTLTAGTYAITIGEDTNAAYDKNADLIALTKTPGAIVVAVPHVCAAAETVRENEVAATCYAEGYYEEVVKCSCGKELSRTAKTIDKIAHTPAEAVVENNVAATCYAEGSYDSVVYCSVEACKAEIQREPVTVEKTEHTPAEAVVENNKAATCEADGSYDSVVYCSVEACKFEISRTPVTVEALGHDYVDGVCGTCGGADPDYEEPVAATLTYTSSAYVYKNAWEFGVNISGLSYSGDKTGLTECGIMLIRQEYNMDLSTVTPTTEKVLSLSGSSWTETPGCTVTGFAFNKIDRKYIFVPYIVVNGECIKAEAITASYADVCVWRMSNGTVTGAAKAKKYLDAYYTNYGVKLYEDSTKLTYDDNTARKVVADYADKQYDFPTASSELNITTSELLKYDDHVFGINIGTFQYIGTGTVTKYGILALRSDKNGGYTGGVINKDTAGVMVTESNSVIGSFTVSGFALSKLTTDYIFVPYVILEDGTEVQGQYIAASMADYLITRVSNVKNNYQKAFSILESFNEANFSNGKAYKVVG